MTELYYQSKNTDFSLYKGDTLEVLPRLDMQFDMVFADPPYFLSNDGLTIKSGKISSVNKGKWDTPLALSEMHSFNKAWLSQVKETMKDDATLWVSGTAHNIFSVGLALQELDFKILNIVTWEKSNPPPNFSCRTFTHSTEQIIWARKMPKVAHYYNYALMKMLNSDKQMKDVWTFPASGQWEKSCGKHPTQKPLAVLTRLILASSKHDSLILDPFTGSSTTGIAANLLNRRFVGIDNVSEYLELSKSRREELNIDGKMDEFRAKLRGFTDSEQLNSILKDELTDSSLS